MSPPALFNMFGHECDIFREDKETLRKKSTCSGRLLLWINSFRTLNETNRGAYTFFRSYKKLKKEKECHLDHVNIIIHPFSDFRKYWEMLMIFVILFQFVTIPLDLAYNMTNFKESRDYFKLAVKLRFTVNSISLIDIFINFISGYLNDTENVVELSAKKIAKKYLLTYFLVDLHTSISIDCIFLRRKHNFSNKEQLIIHGSQLISIFRYRPLVRYICNFFETINLPYIVGRCILTFITFILYAHLVCCTFICFMNYEYPYYVKFAEYPYGVEAYVKDLNFIKKKLGFHYGDNMYTFAFLYARFFYGSLLVIMNSGYCGQVTRGAQFVATIFLWFLSRFLYAVTIGYFMSLQSAASSSYVCYVDMITEVQSYLRHRQIPAFLQKRILAYYDIKYKNCFFKEEEILNTISSQLKQEIMFETSTKMVQHVAFFKGLPAHLLIRIISSLSQDIFLTNDVIIKAGTLGTCMYFISCGTVAVYTKSGKEVAHLQDGDYFGEIALVTNSLRTATVIASDVAELYKLDKKDFIKCILPYPDLYMKIERMAWQRTEKVEILDEINKNKHKKTENVPD